MVPRPKRLVNFVLMPFLLRARGVGRAQTVLGRMLALAVMVCGKVASRRVKW